MAHVIPLRTHDPWIFLRFVKTIHISSRQEYYLRVCYGDARRKLSRKVAELMETDVATSVLGYAVAAHSSVLCPLLCPDPRTRLACNNQGRTVLCSKPRATYISALEQYGEGGKCFGLPSTPFCHSSRKYTIDGQTASA